MVAEVAVLAGRPLIQDCVNVLKSVLAGPPEIEIRGRGSSFKKRHFFENKVLF